MVFEFFGLLSKSPTHTGLISRLGPFKETLRQDLVFLKVISFESLGSYRFKGTV
jgi:hypothetical protein